MRLGWLGALAVLGIVCCRCALGAVLAPAPELSSIAYLLYDGDYDCVVLEQNAWQRRSVASLTKVMTLLTAIELVEEGQHSLNETVLASSRAASREGTQIKLKAGDQFTLEELLYATALASANDAAVALAEHVAGSEAAFTELMNARAQELGLKDTHFVDCTGLLSIFSNNYSTAYDQARLFQKALEYDLFRTIVATPEYYLAAQGRKIPNTHPFLDLAGVEGGKTGATTPAGHTLITSRLYPDQRRLIAVILGARSREVRNEEMGQLLEWAAGNLKVVIPAEEIITAVVVPDGVDHQIHAVLARNFSLFAKNPDDLAVESKIELAPQIKAPIERGAKLGELVIWRHGLQLTRLDLVAQQGTGLASWLRRIFNRLVGFFKRIW